MALSEQEELEMLELEEQEHLSKQAAPSVKPQTSIAESGVRGAGQGASLGFQDEIAGAMGAIARPFGLKGFGGDFGDMELTSPTLDTDEILGEYSRVRDIERKKNQTASDENPYAYGTGQVGGGIMNAFAVPGLNAAKGAGLAATTGKAALQGGLAGLGMSDEDSLGGLAVDTGAGSLLGGGMGATMYGAGKATDLVTPYIKNLIAKGSGKLDDIKIDSLRQIVGGTPKQQAAISDDVLRSLQKDKTIGLLDDAGSVAKKIQEKFDASSAGLDDALQTLDDSGAQIPIDKLTRAYDDKIMELRQGGRLREARSLLKERDMFLEDMENVYLGDRGLKASVGENIKRDTMSDINYNADTGPTIAGKKGSASIQRQAVEDVADEFDPSLGERFRADKKVFSDLLPVQDAAYNQAERNSKKSFGRFFDPTKTAKEVYKSTIGRPATKAFAADKIGDLVKNAPETLGKYASVLQQASQRGPQGVASTHFLLMQTDPDYRILLDKIAGDNNDNTEQVGQGYPAQ